MADDDNDYGAAQPLMDKVRGAYKAANDVLSNIPGAQTALKLAHKVGLGDADQSTAPGRKSWQADPADVQKATQSFQQKPAEGNKIPTQTMAQKKVTTPTAKATVTVKAGPRKKI